MSPRQLTPESPVRPCHVPPRSQWSVRRGKDSIEEKCFYCKEAGHLSRECPVKNFSAELQAKGVTESQHIKLLEARLDVVSSSMLAGTGNAYVGAEYDSVLNFSDIVHDTKMQGDSESQAPHDERSTGTPSTNPFHDSHCVSEQDTTSQPYSDVSRTSTPFARKLADNIFSKYSQEGRIDNRHVDYREEGKELVISGSQSPIWIKIDLSAS
ncbi:hypothetical protein V8E54_001554 [Elaphomyces granulatus]